MEDERSRELAYRSGEREGGMGGKGSLKRDRHVDNMGGDMWWLQCMHEAGRVALRDECGVGGCLESHGL